MHKPSLPSGFFLWKDSKGNGFLARIRWNIQVFWFKGQQKVSQITTNISNIVFFNTKELKWFPRVDFFTLKDYDRPPCLDRYMWSIKNFISGLFCNFSSKVISKGHFLGIFYQKNGHFYGRFCGKVDRISENHVHMSHISCWIKF